jgi:hypothetical protein
MSDITEDYCPRCETAYFPCIRCEINLCNCEESSCLCDSDYTANEDNALGVLNAYLQEYEIPEVIKGRK